MKSGGECAARMDDTFLRTMLFDFYGDLLTENQREYYDLHYNNDLSLFEIAEMSGTTRQAVWDIVRRAEQSLREIETKTGLVEKAVRQREKLRAVIAAAEKLPESEEKQSILNTLNEIVDYGI